MKSAPLLATVLLAAACAEPPPATPPGPAPRKAPRASAAPAPAGPPGSSASTATFTDERLEAAVLRPVGHVLLTTATAVLDWEPATGAAPRSVPVGVSHSSNSPFLSEASPSFVVAHVQGDEEPATTTLDLWDAATLTKLRTLEGSWRTGEGVAAFSRDGSRFVFLGCVPVPKRDYVSDCDAAVYALPAGTLLHRTRMPHLRTAIYMAMAEFSPSGRYFAISHETFPTEVHESETGKLVYRASAGEDYLTESALRVAFVDDTHVLGSGSGKATYADLENPRATRRVDFKLAPGDFVSEHRLAPDGRSVALLLVRDERCRIVTWSLQDGAQTSQLLPPAAGPSCTMRWDGNAHLVARPGYGNVGTQIRLDVAAKTQTTEPAVEVPALAAHGFTLHGAFDVSTEARGARIGMSRAQSDPLDESAGAAERPWVTTPTGAKAYVDPQVNGTLVLGDAERLLLLTDRGDATLVRKDGSTARLGPKPVRKP